MDLGVYVHCARECAAREVAYCLEVMPFSRDARLLVWVSRGRLVHHFDLFGTDCETEVVAELCQAVQFTLRLLLSPS